MKLKCCVFLLNIVVGHSVIAFALRGRMGWGWGGGGVHQNANACEHGRRGYINANVHTDFFNLVPSP